MESDLLLALENKNDAQICWFIPDKFGVDVDLRCVDESVTTPMHIAVRTKNINMVHYLYEMKPETKIIETLDSSGQTPVCLAVDIGCLYLVQFLDARGANMSYVHPITKQSMLHRAVDSGSYTSIIETLIYVTLMDVRHYIKLLLVMIC
jgi:ankyrin repeat protein